MGRSPEAQAITPQLAPAPIQSWLGGQDHIFNISATFPFSLARWDNGSHLRTVDGDGDSDLGSPTPP